jgi:hypothetical protein
MAEQHYTGGCQCGKVRYEVTTDLDRTMSCNCSRCSKLGWIISFVPAQNFKLLSGQDTLTDYLFNKHAIHHLFCSICGIESFARGTGPDRAEMVAVNARCLDDIDVGALKPMPFDGKSL